MTCSALRHRPGDAPPRKGETLQRVRVAISPMDDVPGTGGADGSWLERTGACGSPWDGVCEEAIRQIDRSSGWDGVLDGLYRAANAEDHGIGPIYGTDPLAPNRPGLGEGMAVEPDPDDLCTWADFREVISPIVWDWPGWLARGFLHLLASQAGAGKSALMLRIAACYMLGWPWPDGTPYAGPIGRVVWAEAESAQALNLERAENWGVPLRRVVSPLPRQVLLNSFSLDSPAHRGYLYAALVREDVHLGIVDSLRTATAGDESDSRCIEGLKWLATLARDLGKPILLTHHLRKKGVADSGDIDLDRLRGSSAIAQLARLVWAIDVPDGRDREARRLSVIKNNLARYPEPVGFRLGKGGITFGDAPAPPKAERVAEKAVELLGSLLAGGRTLSATEIEVEFAGAGLSRASMKRAKKALGINPCRREGRWWWSLPADASPGEPTSMPGSGS